MTKQSMKVGVIEDIREVSIRELPKPEPGPGEVLIQTKACGLCTWEQRTYSGVDKETRRPIAGGHEFAGVVAQIGEGTKTDLKVGDRIAAGPKPAGRHDMDRYRIEYLDLWGPLGLAEYKAIPVGSAYKLADDLPFEYGCFTEPLACVIHASNKVDYKLGQDVVVIGAGPMGMLNMMVAKRQGARVIVSEMNEKRNDYALELGADFTVNPEKEDAAERVREITDGKGADVVVVAIGNHKANLDAMSMVAELGTVMLFASAHPTTEMGVDPNFIHRKQVTLTGARHPSTEGFETAATLLSKRLINVEPLIEQRIPMTRLKEAFELAILPETYRVIVTLNGEE